MDTGHDLEVLRPSLERMLDGFAVFEAVRCEGEVVDFTLRYINPAGAHAYQRTVDSLIGARLLELVPAGARDGALDRGREIVATDDPLSAPDDGQAPMGVADGRAWKMGDGFALTWRDENERDASAAALRLSEERFHATVDGLADAVSVFEAVRDDAGRIVDFRWTYANANNAVMTGFHAEQLMGRRLLEIFPQQRPAGMVDRYRQVLESGVSSEQPAVWYEDWWEDGTPRRRAFDVRASKVGDGLVVVTRDVTDLRNAAGGSWRDRFGVNDAFVQIEESMGELVIHDQLTGLHNRRHLDAFLPAALSAHDEADGADHLVSVVYLDLDHFKAVNHRHGREAGDSILKAFANLLSRGFRDTDVACRTGGEEFVVVLPGCGQDAARGRVEHLRVVLARCNVQTDEGVVAMPTLSAGIACSPANGTTSEALLNAAGAALCAAKTAGRDQVQLAPRDRLATAAGF